MRVLVTADVHGNYAALDAVLADPHDVLVCLGDMVGYGPEPGRCVERIMNEADVVVRGNHDHALATGAGPGCPPSFQWLAEATAGLGESQLSSAERQQLGDLPLRHSMFFDLLPHHLVHATPTAPLWGHLEPTDEGWSREIREIGPEVLVVGQTHLPLRHHVAGRTIINPGSVGQPRHGDNRAAYIIIEEGNLMFCRVAYDVERTVRGLVRSGVEPAATAALVQLLRTGQPSLYLTRSDVTPACEAPELTIHAP